MFCVALATVFWPTTQNVMYTWYQISSEASMTIIWAYFLTGKHSSMIVHMCIVRYIEMFICVYYGTLKCSYVYIMVHWKEVCWQSGLQCYTVSTSYTSYSSTYSYCIHILHICTSLTWTMWLHNTILQHLIWWSLYGSMVYATMDHDRQGRLLTGDRNYAQWLKLLQIRVMYNWHS